MRSQVKIALLASGCSVVSKIACRPRSRLPAQAFTIIEVITILAVLAICAVMLLPVLAKRYARVSRVTCASNMKQIGLSFLTWGTDNQGRFPMSVPAGMGGTLEAVASGAVFPHFQAISNELATPRILLCPNDKTRSWTSSFTNLADTNIS